MNTKIPIIILIAMSALVVNGQAGVFTGGVGAAMPALPDVTVIPDMNTTMGGPSAIIKNFTNVISTLTEETFFENCGICMIQCCGICPDLWNGCQTCYHFICASPFYKSTMYCLRLTVFALPMMLNYGLNMLLYSTLLGWICPIISIGITAPCCFCCCLPLICSPVSYLFTIGFGTLTGVVGAFATVYESYGEQIGEAVDDAKGFGGVPLSVPTGR